MEPMCSECGGSELIQAIPVEGIGGRVTAFEEYRGDGWFCLWCSDCLSLTDLTGAGTVYPDINMENIDLAPAPDCAPLGDGWPRADSSGAAQCSDCRRRIYYSTRDDSYHHIKNPEVGCFLILSEIVPPPNPPRGGPKR